MAQFDRSATIERVENPEPDTEERRKQADVIDSEWDKDTSITQMADMAGYSRQHVINTLNSHYKIVEEPEPELTIDEDETIEVPKSILDDEKAREAFVRGFEAAYNLSGKAT